MNARVGQFVAAQTRSDRDDQYAVGVFVDAGNRTPVIKVTKASEVIDGITYYKGDYVLKVRWFKRDLVADGERRTFIDDPAEPLVRHVCSTELRMADFLMEEKASTDMRQSRRLHPTIWVLSGTTEGEILEVLW